MPKMKTHRAGAKRYRITANGKVICRRAGRSHLNLKKAANRKRALDNPVVIHESNLDRIAAQLPYMHHARR
ncbi:MAG: 50S ribosomal protein L35 [Vampirovibrionales bacterium]|nr:50S ribosomal protein L35 [Vampirovibrionales bacterium]